MTIVNIEYNDYRKVPIASVRLRMGSSSAGTFENGFVKCRLDEAILKAKADKFY
jgi:hypothetical protein